MENTILDELIVKYRKNSRLINTDSELYENTLLQLLINNEYCDEIEYYLCDGPLDSSMKVLAQYAKLDIDKARKILKKFIYCQRIAENRGGVSGMKMVYLLVHFIDENIVDTQMNKWIFKSMVKMAYKNGKEGTNKKVVELIRDYILPKFSNNINVVDLSFLNDDDYGEELWIKIRDLFIECAYQSSEVTMEIKEKLFYWLKNTGREMGKYTEEYLAENYIETKKNIVQPNEDLSKQIKIENNSDSFKLDKVILKLVEYISSEDKVINQLQIEVERLKTEIIKIQSQISKSIAYELSQDNCISDLRNENQLLSKSKQDLEKTIDELNHIVEGLKSEIYDRKQFTDTVARNREKQSEEFVNKLASKLKIDYNDFCDAKELEMNIDLGENMRAQLESVFSILEKHGIRLK